MLYPPLLSTSLSLPDLSPIPLHLLSKLTHSRFLLTVTIRFQPIGSAPHLRQRIFKISASNNFSTVVNFLRKRLFDSPRAVGGVAEGAGKDAGAEGKGEGKGAEASKGEGKGKGGEGAGGGGGSVFCYVNSVFAPGLDEGVGALWRVSVYFPPFLFGIRSFFGDSLAW